MIRSLLEWHHINPLRMCINLYYFPLPIILPVNENSQSNLIGVNSAHSSLIFSNSNNTYTMRGATNNSKEQTIKLKFLTWLFDSSWAKFTSSITLWEFALWEIFLAAFFFQKKTFSVPFPFSKGWIACHCTFNDKKKEIKLGSRRKQWGNNFEIKIRHMIYQYNCPACVKITLLWWCYFLSMQNLIKSGGLNWWEFQY